MIPAFFMPKIQNKNRRLKLWNTSILTVNTLPLTLKKLKTKTSIIFLIGLKKGVNHMLDKMLIVVADSEPETAIPEYDEDASYWDAMSSFHEIDTDYFSVNAVRTF